MKEIQLNDYIKVKKGIKDPDFKNRTIEHYTGCITNIEDNFVEITWDDKTLKNFNQKFIKLCDKKNLDHTKMWLEIDDVDIL